MKTDSGGALNGLKRFREWLEGYNFDLELRNLTNTFGDKKMSADSSDLDPKDQKLVNIFCD